MRLPAAFVRPSSLFRKEVTNRFWVVASFSDTLVHRWPALLNPEWPSRTSIRHFGRVESPMTRGHQSCFVVPKLPCSLTVALENGHDAASRQSPALTGLSSM